MQGKNPGVSALLNESVLVSPSDLNSDWSMHGGKLFSIIDEKAAIVARRHSGYVCRTVAGSAFKYLKPIYTGDEVIVDAKITRSWKTSMEIKVTAYFRKLKNDRKRAMTIYIYFIAVENETLMEVPPVTPSTKQEVYEYERASIRRKSVKGFIEEEEKSFERAGFSYF